MKKTLLIILGALVIIIIAGVVWYVIDNKSNDETANWKTYTNTKYGFEIKYPNTFIIKEGPTTDSYSVEFLKDNQTTLSSFEISVGILFDEKSLIDQILSGHYYKKIGTKIIADKEAQVFEGDVLNGTGTRIVYYFSGQRTIAPFEFSNLPFCIGFNKNVLQSTYKDIEEFVNQILSTFKFIENDETNLKITFPNGGESLVAGKAYNITWESQKTDKVFIYLSKKGESDVTELIAENIQASLDKYYWKIPTDNNDINLGGQFKIKISAKSNNNLEDESDDYFEITK